MFFLNLLLTVNKDIKKCNTLQSINIKTVPFGEESIVS